MEQDIVRQLPGDFEKHVYVDQERGVEFWLARELQVLLGYTQWRSFEAVIEKAITSCINAGYEPDNPIAFAQTYFAIQTRSN
jgi:DNA-damage-inducible protein D